MHYALAAVCRLYVLIFLDEFRKFTISDFPKPYWGTDHSIFFPTPTNRSTLNQNVFFVLDRLEGEEKKTK